MDKWLNPTQAIKLECKKYCKNGLKFECVSTLCPLNNKNLTSLKKIKAHCITCVPEQSSQGVRLCTGEVTNPEPHKCPLWVFRLGHNPKLKGKRGNINNLRKNLTVQ